MAERIAAPQRLPTRAIYSSKWTVFQRRCREEQGDFRNPSISDISNFFWYLFNVLNRCPSTIEGYRTAIADTLGNSKLNISINVDIARLITSFYRDKPKSSRPIPKWNLSIVLHRLAQPPFEPLEDATLKFLTWKTVFLLALALGKRCSEIHAWTLDGQGPQAISPVVIPALKRNQDPQDTYTLLCPVRALRCYLDRTKDSRGARQLLFISFKMIHIKDIQCSTILSWLKNTIKFGYSKVENADMDLSGVKAHDVRAFAASKTFYGGGGGVNGPNYASLPLEITQHLHQVLPQGSHRTRSNRGLLSSGRLRRSTAGDASSQTDSRDKRKGGHASGNH